MDIQISVFDLNRIVRNDNIKLLILFIRRVKTKRKKQHQRNVPMNRKKHFIQSKTGHRHGTEHLAF